MSLFKSVSLGALWMDAEGTIYVVSESTRAEKLNYRHTHAIRKTSTMMCESEI